MIKRALIHVENMDKISDVASYLANSGWTIHTANKTEEYLHNNGIPVVHERALSENFQYLEEFATLSRQILTSHFTSDGHYPEYQDNDNGGIFLVCMNFYPQVQTVSIKKNIKSQKNNGHKFFITSLLRAAFFNYENIIILSDPADYEEAMIQMKTDNVSEEFRIYLAGKALNLVAADDGGLALSVLMNSSLKQKFLNYLVFPFEKQAALHVGANPQQEACLYKYPMGTGITNNYNKVLGREYSYNLIMDISYAWNQISMLYAHMKTQYSVKSTNSDGYNFTTQFTPQTATVFTIAVKHQLILGSSLSTNVLDSFKLTYVYDSTNIKNAILGCSSVIDESAAAEIVKSNFAAVVAPDFTPGAKEILSENKNIKLVPNSNLRTLGYDLNLINGGLLFQTNDSVFFNHWYIKTKHRPSQNITDELAFGTMLSMTAHSCSALLLKNNAIIGVAQGCKSSESAVELALHEAKAYYKKYQPMLYAENQVKQLAEVLVCDFALEMTDSVKTLIDSGLTAIIQTGGDEGYEEFINYCDEHNVIMIFTGMPHLSY